MPIHVSQCMKKKRKPYQQRESTVQLVIVKIIELTLLYDRFITMLSLLPSDVLPYIWLCIANNWH